MKVVGEFWDKPAAVAIRQNSFLLCKVPLSKKPIPRLLQQSSSAVSDGRLL